MIKSRANEGFLAPGFKLLSFAERRDFKMCQVPCVYLTTIWALHS
jgi:hypothetical protein